MNVVCKQALTNNERVRALAEFVLKKKGMDPAILNRAGIHINLLVTGTEEDTVYLVTIEQL